MLLVDYMSPKSAGREHTRRLHQEVRRCGDLFFGMRETSRSRLEGMLSSIKRKSESRYNDYLRELGEAQDEFVYLNGEWEAHAKAFMYSYSEVYELARAHGYSDKKQLSRDLIRLKTHGLVHWRSRASNSRRRKRGRPKKTDTPRPRGLPRVQNYDFSPLLSRHERLYAMSRSTRRKEFEIRLMSGYSRSEHEGLAVYCSEADEPLRILAAQQLRKGLDESIELAVNNRHPIVVTVTVLPRAIRSSLK